MDERTIEVLELLGRVLMAAAVAVLVLAVLCAILIAGSESSVPGLDTLQRENRGVFAVAALGAGIVGAGILAGLGGILRVLLDGRRERLFGPNRPHGA